MVSILKMEPSDSSVRITHAHAMVDQVLIRVHGNVEPSEEDWLDWADLAIRNAGTANSLVAITPGPGPNTKQSKQLADRVVGAVDRLRTCVLTPSRFAGGIVTVIGWVGANINACALAQLDAAVDDLQIPRDKSEGMRQCSRRLELKLSGAASGDYPGSRQDGSSSAQR